LIPARGTIAITRQPSGTNSVENEFITLNVDLPHECPRRRAMAEGRKECSRPRGQHSQARVR
jgi:hypothetical protein